MVDSENQMTMDDLDQIINDNPPGSPEPEPVATDNPVEPDATSSDDNANSDGATADTGDATQDADEGQNTPKRNMNDAFAAMRVQNKKITNALAAVLQQHGLDPALAQNPDKLIQDAEDARLEAEAKKQKVPTELLQRLTQLEKINLENQQKRLTDAALAGFQAVKNKYNLSSQEVSAFAKQLQDAGTNPFEQEMDLDLHYRLHNLDKIIAAEKQKAVEEALRNQNTATQHSTAPTKTQGRESSGVDTIDTMAQFDRFLAGLSK